VKVRFWGVRGSIPTPEASTRKMGGNTSCVEVIADGEVLIFDAGSGIRPLGLKLLKEGKPVRASLFFTHVHHDHIQGFPFFVPAFIPTTTLKVYGETKEGEDIKEQISSVMTPPFFPVPIAALRAQMEYIEVKEDQTLKVSPRVNVIAARLNHPNGAIGYRVEAVEKWKKRVFAYCTDTEHKGQLDENVVKLARGADAMAYDSFFTPEEYETKKGWGHSTWAEAVKVAKKAKAKRLLLFHHDPTHSDRDMAKILEDSRKQFKPTLLAYEGLELSF
jgi:phosphoribosyl 1,2-cyclic phosphodiesterase